jgi:hypothetical protein
MRLWLLDHGAFWTERIGGWLSSPFMRLSRRLTDAWFEAKRERR